MNIWLYYKGKVNEFLGLTEAVNEETLHAS